MKIKTIALVAPSGLPRDYNLINKQIEILEKKFKVKKFFDESAHFRYMSDSDENRTKYFEAALLDSESDLVLSIRGGFGALRIVDKLNYDAINEASKKREIVYAGSSDATIFLASLSKKTNVKCFHSLMITNGFCSNLEKNIDIIENNKFNLNLKPLNKGEAQGYIWGGNLSSLVSMLSGEFYLPDEDIILFLEDLNEPSYKVDKMLYELYRFEALRAKIKGLIFGDFYLEDSEIMPLAEEYSKLFNVSSWVTSDITHKRNNVTIPYFAPCKLS